MNKIKLIEDLITDVEALKYDDENSRDALTRKAEMIIRKIFGDTIRYIKDLDISF